MTPASRLLLPLLLLPAAVRGAEPAVDYVAEIKPLLAAHCGDCHGADLQEADLRLDTAAGALRGGNSGPAVVAGDSGSSRLILAVTGRSDDVLRMPPEGGGDPLTEQQIDLLQRWIDQGAKHPEEAAAADADVASDHWSFQPLERPDVPPSTDPWIANPIDAFLLRKMRAEGVGPSPPAGRARLIRRVTLDLIGLPPTPEEVDEFVNDPSADAYAKLVARLLASPHYGERWGRRWLDLARYADSDGYTNDVARTMWRYRDWVIDALNRDLPFDQFTIDQLAGDLLPDATIQQQIATGFHRNTQRNREGGSDAEQYRVEAVVDRVSTTGSVFLGLTLGCARCHDHKYDPVRQREFYELFAFFNSQDEPQLTVPLDNVAQEQLADIQRQRRDAEQALQQRDQQLAAGQAEWEKQLTANDKLARLARTAAKERTKEQQQTLTDGYRQQDAQRQKLAQAAAQLKAQEDSLRQQGTTTTLVMRERPEPRQTHVMIRGDFLRPGREVQPAVPAVLPPIDSPSQQPPSRLDFARWLVADEQPLTARVTVNRAWMHLFGRGLVETENDFGAQGTGPSHPELLDWLACELVERGWSMKELHRVIVSSAAYRQDSRQRAELTELDPENRLLARQSRLRLEAEAIRDSALRASGLLCRRLKGPSVYPPQPAGVMKMTRNPNRKWVVSTGGDRYRRGMYTYFWRSTPYPFLRLFNAPESNTACTRRGRSNTPFQALTLLNDEVFLEAAAALASRAADAPADTLRGQLNWSVRRCLSREGTTEELAALEQLWEETADDRAAAGSLSESARRHLGPRAATPEGAAWLAVARVLLNLDEFITRE